MLHEEIKPILERGYVDLAYFDKTILPDMFYSDFSPLHEPILEKLNSKSRKVAIAAPRGIGKTTLVKGFAIRSILYRDVNFILYISRSATHAEMQTENIKNELLGNKYIRKIFGDVRVADGIDLGEQFSKKSWVAFGDVLVLPRGAGQQIRGLNWRNYRPQLIIVDDLEDKNELRNEILRQELKEWFFSDVMKSVNKFDDDWRVFYIDTLKHEDSLLQALLDSEDWDTVKISVCDENLHSLDPNFMTDDEIREELETLREKNLTHVFYMEYMNIVSPKNEDAAFSSKYFKYYEETDDDFVEKVNSGRIETVILADIAKTAEVHSADSAIVVVGVDTMGNAIYVRNIVAGKMHPDEFYKRLFEEADRFNVRVIGIEVTGLNEFITYPVKNEMIRRGKIYELVELKPRKGVGEYRGKGKEGRVAALAPMYRLGLIYHNRNVCDILEMQLLSFPRSKKWDVMDAFAYIVELMDKGMRYFYPAGDEISYDDEEVYYEELEKEDEEPIEGWRIV